MTCRDDIFETIKTKLKCQYISDIRNLLYIDKAKEMMRNLNLEKYPLYQLSDMASYLYSEKISFENFQEAIDFFKSCN